MKKRTLNKLIADEKGQALVLVLILMLVGGLIIAPLLAYMSTGIKVGKEVFEERMYGQYAADAGVEDALYRIKRDDPALPTEWEGVWDKNAYDKSFPYSIPQLNGNDVDITIQPQWALEGLGETPPLGMTPHADLVIVGDTIGTANGNGLYQISINYLGTGQLHIERIGAWLPAGYSYLPGTSNLEKADPSEKYYCEPVVVPYRGGEAIRWNYGPPYPKFEDFPGSGNKRIVTFQFTPQGTPVSAFSWVVTRREDIHLSWDVDIKIYKITSQATDTDSGKSVAVEAYAVKNEFREQGGIGGDYQATGNTLMRDHNNDSLDRRERLYEKTSAIINDIPDNAEVERVYLYWSGWINDPWNAWDIDEDGDNDDDDEALRQALPADENIRVDTVTLVIDLDEVRVGGDSYDPDEVSITITADTTQVLANRYWNSPGDYLAHGWSYSCHCDVTDELEDAYKARYGEDEEISFNGVGNYTVGHAFLKDLSQPGSSLYEWKDSHVGEDVISKTDYPLGSGGEDEWSYAAWSVIVIYSSPETKGHQIYIFDDFLYADNDTTQTFTITGFLAPEEVVDDPEAARITCFVGEGDEIYSGDKLKLNEEYLSAPPVNPENNVWNAKSSGLAGEEIDGIDIDTFTVSGSSGVIQPGDSEAVVELPTRTDSWNLVYIILSFRSKITTSGAITYMYMGGG